MAYKFPSDEWIKALQELLNNSESYQQSAKDWEGNFIFVIEADDALPETGYLLLELHHGKSPGAAHLDPANLPEVEYTINASFSTWKKVIDGILEPIPGMMTGKLKLKGNLMKIIHYPKAAQEIVSCCAEVPTDW